MLPVGATRPWCPVCEWGPGEWDPAMAPYRGTRLLSRWGFRRGRALDDRLLLELTRDPEQLLRTSPGQWWLMGVSLLIVVLGGGCLWGLVWVWAGQDWPVGVRLLASLVLLALVAALFPAPLHVPKATRIPQDQGLEFRRLVDQVAAAVGTRSPDAIVVDMSFNAGVARFGWRQQTLLVIGAPLWAMLPPPARLSVLAHEFGHLVNKDPMRSVLTLPARTFGARAVAATGGRDPWRRAFAGVDNAAWYGGGIAGLLVHGTMAVVNTVAATVQLLVDSVAMPDSRRAEYLADLKARQVAGSTAFVASSERLLISQGIWQDLWDWAPRMKPSELGEAIERSALHRTHEIPLLRQATLRTSDLWSSHPAESNRIALVETLPRIGPSVDVSQERWETIDAEMSGWYTHIHHTLLGTRDPIRVAPGL
jgi:heat shock protein HtpX